ncbi:MAG: SpoIID/LytB domain-containing protein [Candidatus Aminicenantales bacterium]
MSKILSRNHKYFFLSFLVLFFLGGRPVEFGQEATFFQGFLIAKPVIRIALGLDLEDVLVHASSGMKVYQAAESYTLLAEDIAEVRVKGQKDQLNEKFLVQVAQTRRREEADSIARDLRPKIARVVMVAEGKNEKLEGVYQVQVGDFLTRGEALSFIKGLAAIGYPEAWILREEVTRGGSRPQWVMIEGRLVNLSADVALYLIPSNPQSYLTYEGRNYRGIFVLRGSSRGTLLINILNLEDYLKGVVPGELSPYYFGELEALKAQAVAARTYALRNLGQFEDLGFDLYATPQSQVYEGMSIEHPKSTRAVEETAGQVAVYDGKLINALYTSTCGGATENVEEIFEGNGEPYLRSVECVMENESSWSFHSTRRLPAVFEGGANIASKMAVLAALGVFVPGNDAEWFRAPVSPDEAKDWLRKTAAIAGKKADMAPVSAASGPMTPTAFAGLIRDAFGWRDRIQTLVGKSEAEHATLEIADLTPEEKPLLAYFLISGIYSRPTALRTGTEISRTDAAVALSRVLGLVSDSLHRAKIRSIENNSLVVIEDDKVKMIPLGADPYLLRSTDGVETFVSELDLETGDSVQWLERDGRVSLIQADSISLSNVLDQPSQFHSWQIRISREDLENRINQYYPIGRLLDLVPQKRGVSKRVVEMTVVGQAGRADVKGLKIRQILNLRDNLFVIDRETDADGRLTHFLFSGKGWGHGVGLCQVGAFRLAQKGASYTDILKKYYLGIQIEKRS